MNTLEFHGLPWYLLPPTLLDQSSCYNCCKNIHYTTINHRAIYYLHSIPCSYLPNHLKWNEILTTITTTGHKPSIPASHPMRECRQHLEFDSIVSDNVTNIYLSIVLVRFLCTSFEPNSWSHTTWFPDDLFAQNYRNIFIAKVYKFSHITYKYMKSEERSWWKFEKTL